MNLTALEARCRTRFQDPNQAIVTNATWDGYLNDAYRDMLNASPWWPFLIGHDQVLVVTAGQRGVALPANVWRVIAVYNQTNQWAMASIEGHMQHIRRYPDQTITGPPERYRVVANQFQVWSTPEVDTTFIIDYFQAPADLAAGVDVPVFSAQWHNGLVEGALARAYVDDGVPSQAAAYQARFDSLIARMVAAELSGQQDRNPEIVDDWFL